MECSQSCLSKPVGHRRNHCSSCHEFFNSDEAFDKHRVGKFSDPTRPRRCLTPEEMTEKGMMMNSAGYWISKVYHR